jgi:hypothetical protein
MEKTHPRSPSIGQTRTAARLIYCPIHPRETLDLPRDPRATLGLTLDLPRETLDLRLKRRV